MGWTTIYGASRADIISERTRRQEWRSDTTLTVVETLKHCVKGRVLWTLRRTQLIGQSVLKEDTWIGCDLLEKDDVGWSYKDMSEDDGPCYYDCPLSYIDAADKASPNTGEMAREWRGKVRKYHAERRARR